MTPLGKGMGVMADSFIGSHGPAPSARAVKSGKAGPSFARFCHFPMESFIGPLWQERLFMLLWIRLRNHPAQEVGLAKSHQMFIS